MKLKIFCILLFNNKNNNKINLNVGLKFAKGNNNEFKRGTNKLSHIQKLP